MADDFKWGENRKCPTCGAFPVEVAGVVPSPRAILLEALDEFFDAILSHQGANDHAWLVRHARDFKHELAVSTPAPADPAPDAGRAEIEKLLIDLVESLRTPRMREIAVEVAAKYRDRIVALLRAADPAVPGREKCPEKEKKSE